MIVFRLVLLVLVATSFVSSSAIKGRRDEQFKVSEESLQPVAAPKGYAEALTPAQAAAPKGYVEAPAAAPKGYAEAPAPAAASKGYAETKAPAAAPKGYAEAPAPAAAPKGYAEAPAPAAAPKGYAEASSKSYVEVERKAVVELSKTVAAAPAKKAAPAPAKSLPAETYKQEEYKQEEYKQEEYKQEEYKPEEYKQDEYRQEDEQQREYKPVEQQREYKPVEQQREYKQIEQREYRPVDQQAEEYKQQSEYKQEEYKSEDEQKEYQAPAAKGYVAQERQELAGSAEPYAFQYDIDGQSRRESGDSNGVVRGSYTLRGADGGQRVVEYVADRDGFRASVDTNEFGTEAKSPAGVALRSSQPLAEKITRQLHAATLARSSVRGAAPAQAPASSPSQAYAATKRYVSAPAPVAQVAERKLSSPAISSRSSYASEESVDQPDSSNSDFVAVDESVEVDEGISSRSLTLAVPAAASAPVAYVSAHRRPNVVGVAPPRRSVVSRIVPVSSVSVGRRQVVVSPIARNRAVVSGVPSRPVAPVSARTRSYLQSPSAIESTINELDQ